MKPLWKKCKHDKQSECGDCGQKFNMYEVEFTMPDGMVDNGLTRKNTPVFSGVLSYFPDALKEVSRVSKAGNDQHNPGSPLHWDRSKSGDELDALTRHLLDHASGNPLDTDGQLHVAKVAWRALAYLQKYLEKNGR